MPLTGDVQFNESPEGRTHEQLVEEVTFWRNVWNNLDPVVRHYTDLIGDPVRVLVRTGSPLFGILDSVRFDLKGGTVTVGMIDYDKSDYKKYREFKTATFLDSNVLSFEQLHEREEVIDDSGSSDMPQSDLPNLDDIL